MAQICKPHDSGAQAYAAPQTHAATGASPGRRAQPASELPTSAAAPKAGLGLPQESLDQIVDSTASTAAEYKVLVITSQELRRTTIAHAL